MATANSKIYLQWQIAALIFPHNCDQMPSPIHVFLCKSFGHLIVNIRHFHSRLFEAFHRIPDEQCGRPLYDGTAQHKSSASKRQNSFLVVVVLEMILKCPGVLPQYPTFFLRRDRLVSSLGMKFVDDN